jgi:hypothetical protein
MKRKRPTNTKAEAEFIAGAYVPSPTPVTVDLDSTGFNPNGVEGVITRLSGPVAGKPWEGLDPRGRRARVFNLKLTDHDLAILRWLAEQNKDLSMQKIARRILVPELHRRAGVEP